jgi:K+-transporting ATPase KdpF subunit
LLSRQDGGQVRRLGPGLPISFMARFLGGVVAAAIAVYLVYALLYPEKL